MWRSIPVWARAVIMGLVVSGVPTFVWALLATINLKRTPAVPWSFAAMAVILAAYWRYVGGDGPPRRLSAVRRDLRRTGTLTPRAWRLALVGGGAAIAAVWAAFASLRGVLHIVPPAADITHFPLWTIFASIVMGSAVAGVAEEAGFRGYMQVPLERAYGPVAAIATTSILFTAIHLTHGVRVLPFLPFYLAAAVIYGTLAQVSGSILPGVLLHFVGDTVMFVLQYANLRSGASAVAASGNILVVPALVAIAFSVAGVIVFRMLAREAIAPAS